MSEIEPDQSEMVEEISDSAERYLQRTRNVLAEHSEELSDIDSFEDDDYTWSFTAKIDGTRLSVAVQLVNSLDYQDQFEGYAVSADAVWEDGTIGAKVAPKNYTSAVWTTDPSELRQRLTDSPLMTIETISPPSE